MAALPEEQQEEEACFVLQKEYQQAKLSYQASIDMIWEYCQRAEIAANDCKNIDQAFKKQGANGQITNNSLVQIQGYYLRQQLQNKLGAKLKKYYQDKGQYKEVAKKVLKMVREYRQDEKMGKGQRPAFFRKWLSNIKDANGNDMTKYMDNFKKICYPAEHRSFWTRQQLQDIVGIENESDQNAILNQIKKEQMVNLKKLKYKSYFTTFPLHKWCFEKGIPFSDCERLRDNIPSYQVGKVKARVRHLTNEDLESFGIQNDPPLYSRSVILAAIGDECNWTNWCKLHNIPYQAPPPQVNDCQLLGEYTFRNPHQLESYSASILDDLGFTPKGMKAIQAVTRPQHHPPLDKNKLFDRWCMSNDIGYHDCKALAKRSGSSLQQLYMITRILNLKPDPDHHDPYGREGEKIIHENDLRKIGVAYPKKVIDALKWTAFRQYEEGHMKIPIEWGQLAKEDPDKAKKDPNQVVAPIDNNPRPGTEGQARQNEYNQYDLYYDDFYYDYGSYEPKQERGIAWIDNMDYRAGHKYDINVGSDDGFADSTIFGVGIVFGVVLMCCICLVFAGLSVVCHGVSRYINRYQFRFAKIGVENEMDQV